MFILIAALVIYFIGVTICLYFFSKALGPKEELDEEIATTIFWPVWVPLVVVFYLPFKICEAAVNLGKQHRKGDKE